MRGAVLHGPYDVRLEQRDDPSIVEPTDAIIRLSATCVCPASSWSGRSSPPTTPVRSAGPATRAHAPTASSWA
jgi:threonine dehydrogenase-like Zn-dependent dehydrogenase